jgi:hypothetical protein
VSEPNEVERLVRIETKLDMLVESNKEQAVASMKRDDDHENRLRGLEQFKWIAIGAGGAAGGVAGLVSKAFGLG